MIKTIAMVAVIGDQFSILLAESVNDLAEGKSRAVTFELASLNPEEKEAVRRAVKVALAAIDQHVLRNLESPPLVPNPCNLN